MLKIITRQIIWFNITFFSFIIMTSCTNPEKIKISDKNARHYVDKVKQNLDSISASELEKNFRQALILSEMGGKYKAYLIDFYGNNFENLTIGDIKDKKKETRLIER